MTRHAAYDPELDREVMVELSPADSGGERRERARVLAQLSHPAVVAVHDAGQTERGVYIVRERVDGRPVDTWAREQRPSWMAVRDVLVTAGRGLAMSEGPYVSSALKFGPPIGHAS